METIFFDSTSRQIVHERQTLNLKKLKFMSNLVM